jgi:hypothetical protein
MENAAQGIKHRPGVVGIGGIYGYDGRTLYGLGSIRQIIGESVQSAIPRIRAMPN